MKINCVTRFLHLCFHFISNAPYPSPHQSLSVFCIPPRHYIKSPSFQTFGIYTISRKKAKDLYTLITIIITMKRILVVISDEAHRVLRDYKEANGYGNMDNAMDAILMERKDK